MSVGCPDKFCVLVSLTYVQLYTGYSFPWPVAREFIYLFFLAGFIRHFFVRSYLNFIAQKSNERKL